MKRTLKFTGIIALISLMAFSCEKEPAQTGKMTVRMKDAPIAFDSVNIEVVRVEVHLSGSAGGWVTLPTNAGIYNLLDLQNDVTAVLAANTELPVGSISQMRLILGSENYVVVDSVASLLDMSSQENTGLKFNLNATINSGQTTEVLIDFDAEKSIVVTGNGSFKLKPVINVESIIYYE